MFPKEKEELMHTLAGVGPQEAGGAMAVTSVMLIGVAEEVSPVTAMWLSTKGAAMLTVGTGLFVTGTNIVKQ